MEVLNFGRILRRWAWLLLTFMAVAGLTAAAVSYELPRVYETQTVALVNPKQILLPGTDASSSLSTQQLVDTYVQLINGTPVQQKLIDDGIPRSVGELNSELKVGARGATTLIDITVRDRDPLVAQRIAEDIIPAFNTSLKDFQTKASPDSKTPQLEALVPWQIPTAAPTTPVSPKPLLNIGLALAAGLALGVGLAFVLEYLDNTVKTEADVRTRLGLNLLGPVLLKGREKKLRRGNDPVALVTINEPKDPVSEGYRAIRTNLTYTGLDRRLQTIVVTSSVPGEGKTSTACNLAVTFAQAANRVVIVDADFRRPALHGVFGHTRNEGLGDAILGTASLESLLLPTRVSNLRLLCSGPTPPNPSELLGSGRMAEILEQLRGLADVIVIDTPPVGAVTDATVLAAGADGVVVVVERGRTDIAAVERTRDKLLSVQANIVGVVLNKVRVSEAAEYYYYRYYTKPVPAGKGRRTKPAESRDSNLDRGAQRAAAPAQVPELAAPPAPHVPTVSVTPTPVAPLTPAPGTPMAPASLPIAPAPRPALAPAPAPALAPAAPTPAPARVQPTAAPPGQAVAAADLRPALSANDVVPTAPLPAAAPAPVAPEKPTATPVQPAPAWSSEADASVARQEVAASPPRAAPDAVGPAALPVPRPASPAPAWRESAPVGASLPLAPPTTPASTPPAPAPAPPTAPSFRWAGPQQPLSESPERVRPDQLTLDARLADAEESD